MPPRLTPPHHITSHTAKIGPIIPSRPAANVSQINIPVARSRLIRQFPQMVAQLLLLVENPNQ